jgi:hypothetical protein
VNEDPARPPTRSRDAAQPIMQRMRSHQELASLSSPAGVSMRGRERRAQHGLPRDANLTPVDVDEVRAILRVELFLRGGYIACDSDSQVSVFRGAPPHNVNTLGPQFGQIDRTCDLNNGRAGSGSIVVNHVNAGVS